MTGQPLLRYTVLSYGLVSCILFSHFLLIRVPFLTANYFLPLFTYFSLNWAIPVFTTAPLYSTLLHPSLLYFILITHPHVSHRIVSYDAFPEFTRHSWAHWEKRCLRRSWRRRSLSRNTSRRSKHCSCSCSYVWCTVLYCALEYVGVGEWRRVSRCTLFIHCAIYSTKLLSCHSMRHHNIDKNIKLFFFEKYSLCYKHAFTRAPLSVHFFILCTD